MMAPVTIKCLPLDRDPMRAKIRIEPAKVKQIGQHLCPMELKLYGRVESREKFSGKAVFVGPHYLSGFTVINFAQAGSRNVTGTYQPNWKPKGGFTTDPSAQLAKQKLTFYLHVSNSANKLVRSAEETIEVSCRKIAVAVPAIEDGMKVQPAN